MRTCAFRTPPAVLWLCVATQACCRPLLWGLARWGFAVRVFGVGCGVALGGLWGAMLGGWHSGAPGRMRRCAFRQVSQRPVHRQRPPQCFPIRFGPSLRPRLALGVPCSQPFSRRFYPRKGLPTGDWTRFCKLPVKLASFHKAFWGWFLAVLAKEETGTETTAGRRWCFTHSGGCSVHSAPRSFAPPPPGWLICGMWRHVRSGLPSPCVAHASTQVQRHPEREWYVGPTW